MKFAIWQTVDFADCALGYKDGKVFRRVWTGDMEDNADMHVTQLLDRIWIAFQRVDEDHMPPPEYKGRSLSIGDLVHLQADAPLQAQRWYTPAPVGWSEIVNPEFITEGEAS